MPVEFQDYYATLGVPRDADAEEIKKAFRRLARKHHPDVAKDKRTAEETFKQINEAYDVLSDPEKRAKYDRLGERWEEGDFQPPPRGPGRRANGNGAHEPEFHFEGTGFSDFFERYFGGGGRGFEGVFRGGGRAGPGGPEFAMRGSDIEGDLLVTLDEALNGSTRVISLQRENPTTGRLETETIKVRIPPGVREGQAIRVRGKGGPGNGGGEPGDLYLRPRFAAHPDFRVEGTDLFHDLALAPWEGVLGANVIVPTLKGGQAKLRVPAGTNNGRKFRIRGQGLPKDGSGERGDLYAVVNVQLPSQVTAEEREPWEKLRRVSRFNPRHVA